MKKTITLASAMVFALGAYAQKAGTIDNVLTPETAAKSAVRSLIDSKQITPEFPPYVTGAETGQVFFSEDFASNPVNWTNTSLLSTSELWEYRGTATTPNNTVGSQGAFAAGTNAIASGTASNGFMIFDSDFSDNGGDPANIGGSTSPTPHLAALTSPVIDLSMAPAVRLEWQEHTRLFAHNTWVLISTDGFVNQIDTVAQTSAGLAVNAAGPNPAVFSFDVSAFAAGSNNVQIRFLYESTSNANGDGYYYWMIDDVRLIEPPANDLELTGIFFDGAGTTLVNTQATEYYTQITAIQAAADVLTFGSAITNQGGATQPNTRLEVAVTEPAGASNFNTNAVNLGIGMEDTSSATATFTPSAVGNYTVDFTALSDSTETAVDLANNSMSRGFEVTDFVYARDDDNIASGNSFGGGTNYSMFVRYEVNAAETINGVDINFFSQAGFETTDGSIAEVGVWLVADANGAGTTFAADPAADLGAVIASEPFHTITMADFNQTVTVTFPDVELNPNDHPEVLVGFKYVTGQIRFSSTAQDAVDAQTFVDVDNDGVIDGVTGLVPVIRLRTKDANICQNTNIGIIGQTACNTDFTADITTMITGNPAGSVTYLWSTNETTADINVDMEGTYTVTVTDANNCSNSQSFTIDNATLACNLSVNNLDANSFNFSVYPNPNNGQFNLDINSVVARNYNVQVRNIVGQMVYTESVSVSGQTQKNLDLSTLGKGVYFLNVSGDGVEKTQKVIIR